MECSSSWFQGTRRIAKTREQLTIAKKITFSHGPRNILILPFPTLHASRRGMAADVLAKLLHLFALCFLSSFHPVYFLPPCSLYHQFFLPPADPSFHSPLSPCFSFVHPRAMPAEALCIEAPGNSLALPSNNEGIYFINTGYLPSEVLCCPTRAEKTRGNGQRGGKVDEWREVRFPWLTCHFTYRSSFVSNSTAMEHSFNRTGNWSVDNPISVKSSFDQRLRDYKFFGTRSSSLNGSNFR